MSNRGIIIKQGTITIKDIVDTIYEKTVTSFGNSGKVDVPKKHLGMRVYVVVLKDRKKRVF